MLKFLLIYSLVVLGLALLLTARIDKDMADKRKEIERKIRRGEFDKDQ